MVSPILDVSIFPFLEKKWRLCIASYRASFSVLAVYVVTLCKEGLRTLAVCHLKISTGNLQQFRTFIAKWYVWTTNNRKKINVQVQDKNIVAIKRVEQNT